MSGFSTFTIPTRVMTEETPIEISELLNSVDPILQTEMQMNISTWENEMNLQVTKLQSECKDKISRYIQETQETYRLLMTSLKDMLSSGEKQLSVYIHGDYDSCWKKPNVEYWLLCNPGSATAIKVFMKELRSKGWTPFSTISEYAYDSDDGMYSRGSDLIVTCNFSDWKV